MIESADMNDGDILNDTKQENDGKGNIKFKITLKDGHTLTSEWISPDNARKAVRLWVDMVRATAVARSADRQAELNAQIRRQAQEKDRGLIQLPPGVIADHAAGSIEEGRARPVLEEGYAATAQWSPRSPLVGAMDPEEFVKEQIANAKSDLRKWELILKSMV